MKSGNRGQLCNLVPALRTQLQCAGLPALAGAQAAEHNADRVLPEHATARLGTSRILTIERLRNLLRLAPVDQQMRPKRRQAVNAGVILVLKLDITMGLQHAQDDTAAAAGRDDAVTGFEEVYQNGFASNSMRRGGGAIS